MVWYPTILTTSGQRSHNFVLQCTPTMIHKLPIQLSQLPALDRRVFANYLERLDKTMIPASYTTLNSSYQVLEEIWINSMPVMVTNQLIHQESGKDNLQQLTSNTGCLPPKPVLRFHILWVDLITIPLIMVMLSFTLQSFHSNLTLNMFQIQTPLISNQLMMMKWTISWNYSTHNTMMVFWILTSRSFRIDWC